jgi:hypothetical protein
MRYFQCIAGMVISDEYPRRVAEIFKGFKRFTINKRWMMI